MVSMPRSSAHALAGEGDTSIPRPRGLSGAVMMSAGRRPRASSASSTTVAKRGVPKKAKRGLSLDAMLFFELGACRFEVLVLLEDERLVGVEDAVEVVALVLEDVPQKPCGVDVHRRA